MYIIVHVSSRAMAQAVTCRPLTAEVDMRHSKTKEPSLLRIHNIPETTKFIITTLRLWRSVAINKQKLLSRGPCPGSGGYSPASHRGSSGSIPGQSMWDLWWTT
jgi:hypothetical protein